MKKRHMLNLQQKLIKISKKLPKLIKKHYSDEVDYDFVKIDDIYEIINPAFAKYHICIQEMEEKDTKTEFKDGRWIYTSELYFCLVNADQPEEREPVHIHLVGDHEDSPAKAQGAAWTYGLKHFLLYKFQIKQVSEDPDMKGKPADKSAKRPEVPRQIKMDRDSRERRQEAAPGKAPSDIVGKSPLYGRLASDRKAEKRSELPDSRDGAASRIVTIEPDPAKLFESGGKLKTDPLEPEAADPVKPETAEPVENEAKALDKAGGLETGAKDTGTGRIAEEKSEEAHTSGPVTGNGPVTPMPSNAKVVQGKFGSREEAVPTGGKAVNPHFDGPADAKQEGAAGESAELLKPQESESGNTEAEPVSEHLEEQEGKMAGSKQQAEEKSDPSEKAGTLPAEESHELSEEPHQESKEEREEQQTTAENCGEKEEHSPAETDVDEEAEKAAEQGPDGSQEESREEKKPAAPSYRRERRSRKNKKKSSDEAEQMSLLDFAQTKTEEAKETDPDSPDGDPEGGQADKAASETPEGNTAETAGPEEKASGDVGTTPESIEETGKAEEEEETDGFEQAEEIPFEEADEEDFFKELEMEIRDEEEKELTMEDALQTICPYALFEGKTFAEMLKVEAGRKQIAWFATEYMGSDFRVRDAAKLIMEDLEQKAA